MRRAAAVQFELDLQPASPDDRMVHAYVMDILPKGVPSYVRRVIKVTRDRRGFNADLVIFDGGTIRMRVEGPLGEGCYSWGSFAGPDPRPFNWNPSRQRWERVDPHPLKAILRGQSDHDALAALGAGETPRPGLTGS